MAMFDLILSCINIAYPQLNAKFNVYQLLVYLNAFAFALLYTLDEVGFGQSSAISSTKMQHTNT